MPRVVVTGGAGFIASHIVDAYVERGWDVTVIDNLSSGLRENVNPKAQLIEGDVTDPDVIERALADSPDVVNHHAAQIDVRKSVADPAHDAEQNIVASVRLFARAVQAGVRKIIFASSGGAGYGEPQFVPQTEEHPFAPVSPYGIAKVSVEYYLDFFRNVHRVNATALRYANVYGPRQRVDGEAGVVAIFGGRMLQDEEVQINGEGAQTRDYVFVGDVVRANMAVSERDLPGAFNVGTGIETTVTQLAQQIAGALGKPLRARNVPAKAGEQMRSVLDGSKLRRAAGLPDAVTLQAGLPQTMDFLRQELARLSQAG
jgi:UDP-glucose 4-epimerase